MLSAKSVNGVIIRLTPWAIEHIESGHDNMRNQQQLVLQAIREPDLVVEGDEGELSAVRTTASGRKVAVVYRELEGDGFVITAFFLKGSGYYLNRNQVWP